MKSRLPRVTAQQAIGVLEKINFHPGAPKRKVLQNILSDAGLNVDEFVALL